MYIFIYLKLEIGSGNSKQVYLSAQVFSAVSALLPEHVCLLLFAHKPQLSESNVYDIVTYLMNSKPEAK